MGGQAATEIRAQQEDAGSTPPTPETVELPACVVERLIAAAQAASARLPSPDRDELMAAACEARNAVLRNRQTRLRARAGLGAAVGPASMMLDAPDVCMPI